MPNSSKTHNNSPQNVYSQEAVLNGEPLETWWFTHKDFANGGVLELWLGSEPNREWGIGLKKEASG